MEEEPGFPAKGKDELCKDVVHVLSKRRVKDEICADVMHMLYTV